MNRIVSYFLLAISVIAFSAIVRADTTFHPLLGSNLIEGYNYGKDSGGKGRFAYDPEKNVISGGYKGLKMQDGNKAIFAWIHDTVNQKSEYIGPVGWLGKNGSGNFSIQVPDRFKGGNWGSFEVIGFSSEKTGFLKDGKEVVTKPTKPAATESVPSPAFYLFGALPGAKTETHYCGHGKDFFYANAPEKQICYDCICGQKYSVCIAAGQS